MKIYIYILLSVLFAGKSYTQWTELSTGTSIPLRSVSAVDDNVVWVAGQSNGVFRTTNGGLNWTNVSGSGMGLHAVTCIFAIDANNALMGTSDAQLQDTAIIFKTTNGGATWARTWLAYGAFIDGIFMKNGSDAFFVGDPDCTGCSMILRKSTDGGSSWSIAAIYGAGDYGTNNSIFGIDNQIWFGGGSLVYYSTNFGSNWTSQPALVTNGVYAIFFENSLTGMCGGTGKLSITTNSGTLWTNVTYPGTGTVNGVGGYGNTWIVSKIGRNVYITTDNGNSWNTDYTIPQTTQRNFMTKSRNGSKLWDVRSDGTVGRRDAPVGIRQTGSNIPSECKLIGNYPNPFNPETLIKFSVNKSGQVSIVIYDSRGREISVLANRVFTPGEYEITFSSYGLASGVYYYKMVTGNYTKSEKMVLLK